MVVAREPQREEGVLAAVRLEATRKGLRLWRNNVGAVHTADNRFIRFGLANESQQENTHTKSADLIGIRPLLILPEHVGTIVGQFVSRECKHPAWRYAGTAREVAQENWRRIINDFGGDAAFTVGEGSL